MITFRANTQNCMFYNCIFDEDIYGNSSATHQSLMFNNCFYSTFTPNLGNHTNNIIYDHCILNSSYYNYCVATYTNCIIRGHIPDYSTAYNNIFITWKALSENVIGEGNWFDIATNGIYAAEGEDGSYADEKDFAIKYPKLYVGTDGTEVGINGGHGFSRVPATPSIVKSEIDTRAEEGKINVNITVEAHAK